MANVQVTGVNEFNANVRRLANSVTTTREKQRVLIAGARIARNYARNTILKNVVSSKPITYNRKGKKATILPGNLKKSMYAFRMKSGDVAIGPRVLRRISNGDIIGAKPKTSSGFYAHMIYKNAINFRVKVTDLAVSATYTKMLASMEKTFDKILARWQRKYNL